MKKTYKKFTIEKTNISTGYPSKSGNMPRVHYVYTPNNVRMQRYFISFAAAYEYINDTLA